MIKKMHVANGAKQKSNFSRNVLLAIICSHPELVSWSQTLYPLYHYREGGKGLAQRF